MPKQIPFFRIDIYDEQKNSLTLSLRIFDIQESDFGTYTCVASNTLGEDTEAMILYGNILNSAVVVTGCRLDGGNSRKIR